MKILKSLFFPLVSLAVVVFALSPLFHSGFFTIHDDEQIARLFDLNQAIFSGNIPPRIAPNLGFGYGYPFFNFYPPFAYYISENIVWSLATYATFLLIVDSSLNNTSQIDSICFAI